MTIKAPSFEYLGGVFDALGDITIYRTKSGRQYISVRTRGPIGLSLTDNAAYKFASNIRPYTILQNKNLEALMDFYEQSRQLGFRIRINKRWNNCSELEDLYKKREEVYTEFLTRYSHI